jgi:nucleoside-diphosphate-sugar epimerase
MSTNGRFLLTGANGFVGRGLQNRLAVESIPVRTIVRKKLRDSDYEIGNITKETDWANALIGCDVVIHLAARTHVMNETAIDPLAAFRAANVLATKNLALQAVKSGVRRFVFVSSVKVNGETTYGRPFEADDMPAPLDAYGKSKLEAEQALAEIAQSTGLEVVVVRPPLVYGPGVEANFLRLMQLVKSGFPLPLGSMHNLRSMVARDNLVDLLFICACHPAAVGETFLISDEHDVSTSDLIRMLAAAMGKTSMLLPAPKKLLSIMARVTGKSAIADRLLGSLQIDIKKTRIVLGWQPIVTMEDAIDNTVAHFLSHG